MSPDSPAEATRSPRQRLVMRDQVIGLQAEADTARRGAEDLERRLQRTADLARERRERIERLRERVARLERENAALEEALAVRRGGSLRRGARAARRALSRR